MFCTKVDCGSREMQNFILIGTDCTSAQKVPLFGITIGGMVRTDSFQIKKS